MEVTVAIDKDHIVLSEKSMEQVRLEFNPSGFREVEIIKSPAAAMITYCDIIGNSREFSLAKTAAEEASMWATKGVTAER